MTAIGYVNNFHDNLNTLISGLKKEYDVKTFYGEQASIKNITEQLAPGSIILWRMLEGKENKLKHLGEKLSEEGYLMINPYSSTRQSDDKLEAFKIFSQHKIPTIPTWECAAGVNIPDNHIVKPRFGLKGKNVLFGDITVENISEPASKKALASDNYDWIMQPYIPESHQWLRVLIVDGNPIVAYKRVPPQGRNIANVTQGAKRVYVPLDEKITSIAARAAKTLNLTIAGVDITHAPHLIVEANSVPSIPNEAVEKFAEETIKYVQKTLSQ
jgi:glutathione synthase/RimK-type ligase-like ATP-grasp enzyme